MPGLSVGEIAARVGRNLMEQVTDGGAAARRVTGVVLDEPGGGSAAGCLVVAAGRRRADVHDLLHDVAAREATGVVLPPGEVGADAVALAAKLELAVWRRARDADWLTVVDAVRQLVSGAGDVDQGDLGSVPPGDLPRLADAFADMLGGPVIIEDARFEVLGYSTFTGTVDHGRDAAILGRRMPLEWLGHLEAVGALDTLLTSGDVVDLSDGPWQARRRLLCAIRDEGQLLGILWVAEAAAPLPADVATRIGDAARIASPHLRRHQESQLAERTGRARSLRMMLLDGEAPIRSLVEELELVPAAAYVVLAVRPADGATSDVARRGRLVDCIALYCQAYRWRAATTSIGGTAYCLVALSDGQAAEPVDALAQGLLRNSARVLGRAVHVAVSEQDARLEAVVDLRAQAERVLHTLERRAPGDARVLTTRDAAPQLVLDRLAAAVREHEAGEHFDKIDVLRAYDEAHATTYTRTLAAYLAAHGNVSRAAAELGLHRTTLRYRLRRVGELAGIDLDDPDERLLCALLLRDGPESCQNLGRP